MTLAAIDIGTNSIKLLLGRVEGPVVTPLLHRSINTRLGEGLESTGRISSAAADRTLASLRELKALVLERGADRTAAVGTLVFRAASNGAAFIERCRAETGLEVRILSGEEEARLSFLGASWATTAEHIVAVDIGGGSTEVMVGNRSALTASWSLPVGAVTLTERFLRADPPGAEEMQTLSAEIRRQLLPVVTRAGPDGELVGIGGTVSSILALLRKEFGEDPRDLQKKTLPFDTVSSLAIHLSLKTTEERERMGLERGRADIIVAGAWILVAVMSHLGASTLRATLQGLRHGLLIELASGRWR
jgi:exopolyphosphatase/guanosine-5'-triphosphate,3'-diphosphate pyrophosphatase